MSYFETSPKTECLDEVFSKIAEITLNGVNPDELSYFGQPEMKIVESHFE